MLHWLHRTCLTFPDKLLESEFIGGSRQCLDLGELMLDARTLFRCYATGFTPTMACIESVSEGPFDRVPTRGSDRLG